jgi:hypothetical protein
VTADAYECSQLAGVACLLAIAQEQASAADTLLLPRCPAFAPADQLARFEAEVSAAAFPARNRAPLFSLFRVFRTRAAEKEREIKHGLQVTSRPSE